MADRCVAGSAALLWLAALAVAVPAVAGRPEAEAGARAGAEALAAGRPRAASTALLAAIREDPSYGPAHLLQAQAALALGDAVAAEAEVGWARKTGVPIAETRAAMAAALLAQGTPGRALAEAQVAAPDDAAAWRIRGRIQLTLDDTDEAAASLDQAIALAPAEPLGWVERGRFHLAMGDIAAAVHDANRAAALGPRTVEALLLKGELARAQFGLRAALPWFDKALVIDPQNISALLMRAATLGDAGSTRAMLADTRAVLALLPGNPRALYLQAVLAARARNFALARTLLDRTGGRLDGEWGVMLLHGAIDFQEGNGEQAIGWLQRVMTAMPGNLKVRRLLGAALLRNGDAESAIEILRPLSGSWISDSYALLLLARANDRLGNNPAATRLRARAADPGTGTGFGPAYDADDLLTLRNAAAADARSSNARLEYVEGLIRGGFTGEAVAQAFDLARIYPGAPQAHLLVGDALVADGQVAAAADAYRRAANIAFTEPTALRMIDAYRRIGNIAAARTVLGTFLDQNPRSVAAQLMLANLMIGAREWTDAVAELTDLRARIGDRDALLLNNLAWAHYQAGDRGEGVPLAGLAYRLAPANPAVTQSFGWMLVDSGRDPVTGIDLLERACALAPRSPTVRWHLARAYARAGRTGDARAEIAAALSLPGFPGRTAAWAMLAKLPRAS